MKKFIMIPIMLMLFCGYLVPVKAQTEIAALPAVIEGAYNFTKSFNWRKIKWGIGGFKHREIRVYYADGTNIYDTPRGYRTPMEILQAWSNPRYTNVYGKVVDIKMVIHGKWYSVANTRWVPN